VGPADGKTIDFGMPGVWFMVWSAEMGGQFSLVEHSFLPRTLAARLDRHTDEDK